jgi:O-antigen ligase
MHSPGDDSLTWRSFLFLLVLAPLPSGSISPLAQSFLVTSIFTILTLWMIRSPQSGSEIRGYRSLQLMLGLWAIAIGFAAFQAIPVPGRVIQSVSASLSELYRSVLPAEAMGKWRSVSTTPSATVQSGLLIAAFGAGFILTAHLCWSRARILTLAYTIVLVGAGEAIYALARMGGSLATAASGTFVNRNHYAALLGMALCIGGGLLLGIWQERQRADAADDITRCGSGLDLWVRSIPLIVTSLIILTGIVFSFSRMGLTSPIGILVVLGSVWLFGPVSNRLRLVVGGLTAVSLLLVGGAWPALEVVAARFQTLDDSYRIAAWNGTYRLFLSSPIVGIGLGGLIDNLPRFLPLPISETFDHSHNEFLEMLAEGGAIYATLVLLGLMVYIPRVVRLWAGRRDPLARGLGIGCLAAILAALMYSLVEFPLRMPANGLYLSVIMGLGWAAVHLHSSKGSEHDAARRPRGGQRAGLLVISVVGILLGVIALSAEVLDTVGDYLVEQAKQLPSYEQRALLAKAIGFHRRSATLEPWQPAHVFKLGRAYEFSAATRPSLSDERVRDWMSAADFYRDAVELHPANARFQTALAWAALQRGNLDKANRAATAALTLAPDDREIRFAMAKWYLSQWEDLDDRDQGLARSLVERGAPERPELYVQATWQLIRDPETVRRILPADLTVRRLLLDRLTEERLFVERWAELEHFPILRVHLPERGVKILSYGQLRGRQEVGGQAIPVFAWSGMVEGWLSAGLTATVEVELPAGEALLQIPLHGEAAGGVRPEVILTLGGVSVPVQVSVRDWQTTYLLVFSNGGRFLLQGAVTNGAVILEDGRFHERRATLGRVALLAPKHV